MSDRRDFIKSLLAGGAGAVLLSQVQHAHAFSCLFPGRSDGPWETLFPRILARIKAPTFPDRNFDVTKFGARGDGKLDCTDAFHRSVEACNRAGGGRLVVP